MDVHEARTAPLVSVIVTGPAGPRELAAAIRSALGHTLPAIQVVVAADGPTDARAVVAGLGDGRIELADVPSGATPGAVLNACLTIARGSYIAYLAGRDMHYPHHIRTLLGALDGRDDCQAAYGDCYHTIYRAAPDGTREVLGKAIVESRDFDRFFLMHRGHIPLTALIHRRALLTRTGPFHQGLRAFIAWDFTRRLTFYTDLLHVPAVTAELYTTDPCLEADWGREDLGPDELEAQRRIIRSARPAKPWPKVQELDILYAPSRAEAAAPRVVELTRWVHWPYRLLVAVPPELSAARPGEPAPSGDAGNGPILVPVPEDWPWDARIDVLLRGGRGACVAILPERSRSDALALTSSLHALLYHAAPGEALSLGSAPGGSWGGVFHREDIERARRNHPALSIRRSVEAEGLVLRRPAAGELPFAFDEAMKQAAAAEADGSFAEAAATYQALERRGMNSLWAAEGASAALAHCSAGGQEALRICRPLNRRRPTPATLLLEARLCRRNHQVERAAALLEQARDLLDWTTDRKDATC